MKPSAQSDEYSNSTNNVANKMAMYGDALSNIYNKFMQ